MRVLQKRRQLEAGDHLVGVYGDNWLRAASFSLMAIPLSSRAEEEQASVVSVDAQLVAQREQLKAFKVCVCGSDEISAGNGVCDGGVVVVMGNGVMV